MIKKPTDEMTRDELVAELERLRIALVGPHGERIDSDGQTNAGSASLPHASNATENTGGIDRDAIQRLLSDLAKLSMQYGAEISSAPNGGRPRIVAPTEGLGGYFSELAKDGSCILESYVSGCEWADEPDRLVGDDMSQNARAKRLEEWKNENTEAIEERFNQASDAPAILTRTWDVNSKRRD